VTDLATLAAELLPGATWTGDSRSPGGGAAGRHIAWVRTLRARVPAFDALDPGDLVVAPASALAIVAPSDAELRELMAALADVPISGAILVEGEAGPAGSSAAGAGASTLEAAALALAAAGIPALRLPRTDTQELERSLVGYIVARGAELERQAALLEAELRRRALEGGGVAALVATVSGFLGRALAFRPTCPRKKSRRPIKVF